MTLNILQLCAGKGSRFADFTETPKPFIDVNGKQMFTYALDSLNIPEGTDVRYHLLFQEKHVSTYNPQYKDATVYSIDYYTDGAATSASHVIANSEYIDEQWLIVDCDFVLNLDFNSFRSETVDRSVILVEPSQWDKKSSYSCVDETMRVHGVAEKQPISKFRNTGQYHFQSGTIFMEAYNFFKNSDMTSEGEFYIAPLYNYIIQSGKTVKAFEVNKFNPIGTPKDYLGFIND